MIDTQNNLMYIILIGLFIIILIRLLIYSYVKETFVKYRIGANEYKIYDHLGNPEDAATTMDQLNRVAKKIIYHLNDTYLNNSEGYHSILPKYRNIVKNGIIDLTNNYKTINLQENIPIGKDGDTSYVVDKGEIFALCIRDTENNNTVKKNDMNEKIFVLVHEMAHLFTKDYGHNYVFWNNFRFLLSEAVKINLYKPEDYGENKIPYCGIKISYSPLYDTELVDYLS